MGLEPSYSNLESRDDRKAHKKAGAVYKSSLRGLPSAPGKSKHSCPKWPWCWREELRRQGEERC